MSSIKLPPIQLSRQDSKNEGSTNSKSFKSRRAARQRSFSEAHIYFRTRHKMPEHIKQAVAPVLMKTTEEDNSDAIDIDCSNTDEIQNVFPDTTCPLEEPQKYAEFMDGLSPPCIRYLHSDDPAVHGLPRRETTTITINAKRNSAPLAVSPNARRRIQNIAGPCVDDPLINKYLNDDQDFLGTSTSVSPSLIFSERGSEVERQNLSPRYPINRNIHNIAPNYIINRNVILSDKNKSHFHRGSMDDRYNIPYTPMSPTLQKNQATRSTLWIDLEENLPQTEIKEQYMGHRKKGICSAQVSRKVQPTPDMTVQRSERQKEQRRHEGKMMRYTNARRELFYK